MFYDTHNLISLVRWNFYSKNPDRCVFRPYSLLCTLYPYNGEYKNKIVCFPYFGKYYNFTLQRKRLLTYASSIYFPWILFPAYIA